jgi:hypothetical protein
LGLANTLGCFSLDLAGWSCGVHAKIVARTFMKLC